VKILFSSKITGDGYMRRTGETISIEDILSHISEEEKNL